MRFLECATAGCFQIVPAVHRDGRGAFVKTYQKEPFVERGLDFPHAEEFTTLSRRDVLRGLHFQLPPMDYAKLVCCVSGEVLDAIVDLRVGSPTYGKFETFELSGDRMTSLYLPPGIAHGFLVTGDHALMQYTVSASHAPDLDTGILWDSAGIPWPTRAPILSDRDRGHAPLARFTSPFHYPGAARGER